MVPLRLRNCVAFTTSTTLQRRSFDRRLEPKVLHVPLPTDIFLLLLQARRILLFHLLREVALRHGRGLVLHYLRQLLSQVALLNPHK